MVPQLQPAKNQEAQTHTRSGAVSIIQHSDNQKQIKKRKHIFQIEQTPKSHRGNEIENYIYPQQQALTAI